MTDTNITADEIVVIPEVAIPAGVGDTAKQALALLEQITPQLDELFRLCMEVREVNDAATVKMYPSLGLPDDDPVAEATGWAELWTRVTGVVSDRFSPDGDLNHLGLSGSELRRGGAKDWPCGTKATITSPAGEEVDVEIVWLPTASPSGDHYTVKNLVTGERCLCEHDEIARGLIVTAEAEG